MMSNVDGMMLRLLFFTLLVGYARSDDNSITVVETSLSDNHMRNISAPIIESVQGESRKKDELEGNEKANAEIESLRLPQGGSLIEQNPFFDPNDHDDDDDTDDDDESDDETDDEYSDEENEYDEETDQGPTRKRTKVRIDKFQQNTTAAVKKIKKVPKFLRKHQGELLLLAFTVAFRKEIWYFLKKVFTGGNGVQWNATNVLKLILLLDILRRLLRSSTSTPSESDSESHTDSKGRSSSSLISTLALLLLRSQMNPILSLLMLPLLMSSSSKSSVYLPAIEQHYTFETINHRYQKDGMALTRAMFGASTATSTIDSLSTRWTAQPSANHSSTNIDSSGLKGLLSSIKDKSLPVSRVVHSQSQIEKYNSTIILLDLTLDTSVSQMETIRDKVSFILNQCNARSQEISASTTEQMSFEVCVLLESPGGSAADYALAAQQILRLRNHPNITVTVVVDRVAASGGYMIACTSSPGQLFAAPFAVLGSIGVVGQTVNVQKTLESFGVQPLVFKGGRHKAPVGLVGEITEEGLAAVQGMIDTTHRAFKRHVVESRPAITNIDEIATGETWLGYDALDIGLIDRIVTSDEYISERMAQGALVLKLLRIKRQPSTLFRPPTEGIDFATTPRHFSLFGLRGLSHAFGRARSWIQRSGAFSP